MKKLKKLFSGVLISIFSLSTVCTSVVASPNVLPETVNETLSPGESFVTTKEVTTSAIPAKLDFLLLVDLSGSYADDLVNIKSLDEGLFDSIRAEVPDSRFALASFVDYPTSPWGSASTGDYAFNLDQDFTTDRDVWTGAISALTTKWGGDFPESQYTALKGSAEDASWRPDATTTRIIAITTDASFHVPTDIGDDDITTYPGPSRNATVASLNALDIGVIAIKAPGSGAQMEDIAAATGGSVVTTTSSSSNIASAILAGLGDLPITVIPHVIGCDPLNVEFSPASQTVDSGETASFTETITVPNDSSLEGTNVSCTVVFTDENENIIGDQSINIDILDTPPVLQCIEGANPSGKNIPPAGKKSKGMNEDGFYELFASDNVDESLDLYINGFGPFTSGDTVKITEAPGAEPSMKKIGSDKLNFVVAHLILNSDAVVTATDSSGNTSSVTCYVPPMPK